MIPHALADTSPQQALADALRGTVIGPSAIELPGAHLVVASPLGVVRVDGRAVGSWADPTPVLAAAVLAEVA